MTKENYLKLQRRQFLKLLAATGAITQTGLLSSCLKAKKVEGFDIYWLHFEGAPLRLGFDHWMDPYGHSPDVASLTATKVYRGAGQKITLPEVWFKDSGPSPILNNLMSIRGLSTKSPHLKQSRHEWFSEDFLKKLYQYEKTIGSSGNALSWTATSERLSKIYRPLLGRERESQFKTRANDILSHWKVGLQKTTNASSSTIQLMIANGTDQGLYFENLSHISEDQFKSLMNYYRSLITALESFVSDLKKRDLFQKSMILLTSDRSRVPTNSNFPLTTESLWQGLNLTLISGALTGPVVLGHISKEHPKYKESYPGTWGHGISSWTPTDVHQLLADLCWSTRYTDSKSWVSDNPWMDIKPFHGLYIKKGLGQII